MPETSPDTATDTGQVDDALQRERARPLSPGDRREAILDAVTPLLREHGRNVSSRELAEAAGVAEGTLYRAFGDKDSLVSAAIRRVFDHLALWAALGAVDPTLPFEDKLTDTVRIIRLHFREVVEAVVALGIKERPHADADAHNTRLITALRTVFAEDLDRFVVPLESVAEYLRLVAFASSMPMAVTLDENTLIDLIAHGVIRRDGEETP